MISIAIDDVACVAIGTDGRQHSLSADAIWTGAGWIVADSADAGALLEAHRSVGLGRRIVGLRDAMELPLKEHDGFNRLHYLAALFKRAAEALRERGEPSTADVSIAMPSAAVRWSPDHTEPADTSGRAFYFRPGQWELQRDFERAAQIAGFERIHVRAAALSLIEHYYAQIEKTETQSWRTSVVEVFRSGFSVTSVGRTKNGLELRGRQLFVDLALEDWVVERATATGDLAEYESAIAPIVRSSIRNDELLPLNGMKHGRAVLLQLSSAIFHPDEGAGPTLHSRIALTQHELTSLLKEEEAEGRYNPEYHSVVLFGSLAAIPVVESAFAAYLQQSLCREDGTNAPAIWLANGLEAAAYGVRIAAEREESKWVTSGSAETLEAARLDGSTPAPRPAEEEDVKSTGNDFIEIKGADRPEIGRLSWLLADRNSTEARITLYGRGLQCSYDVAFQLEEWEKRARVEAEVTIEHDDRVSLSTLVDGRPAPAVVSQLDPDGTRAKSIDAIAPGRFELHLNGEHRLVTHVTRLFEHGPHGVVARFVAAPR